MVTAMALLSMVPQAVAAASSSVTFNMVAAPGLKCIPSAAFGRVTLSDLGTVQNLHLEVFGLVPNVSYTVFVTQHGSRPFGFSWYQGEVVTDKSGRGVADYRGIFSEETFLLTD